MIIYRQNVSRSEWTFLLLFFLKKIKTINLQRPLVFFSLNYFISCASQMKREKFIRKYSSRHSEIRLTEIVLFLIANKMMSSVPTVILRTRDNMRNKRTITKMVDELRGERTSSFATTSTQVIKRVHLLSSGTSSENKLRMNWLSLSTSNPFYFFFTDWIQAVA